MTADAIFQVTSTLALAGWILLLIFPRQRWATEWAAGLAIPVVLAATYLVLLVSQKPPMDAGSFSSLDGLAGMMGGGREVMLIGWIHYLTFDLLTGSWQLRRSIERGVPLWAALPCLLPTFLLGPVGFLCFTGVQFAFRGRTKHP